MKRIVTLTMNPTIDRSAAIGQVVAERKLRCTAPRQDPGGGGINVSRAIRKLGGSSLALYACGGPPGSLLQDFLGLEEIEHRPIAIEQWARENITIHCCPVNNVTITVTYEISRPPTCNLRKNFT